MEMKRFAGAAVALLICVASLLLIMPMSTKADNHQKSLDQIDREIENVLKLAGGATAVSAAVSLLPDDSCTPISAQFAELGKYFIAILSALYFEKYFITTSGYVSFGLLIPIATMMFFAGTVSSRDKVKEWAVKMAVCAITLYFMIPVSVKASEMICDNYQPSIEQTIEESHQISVVDEDSNGVEKFLSWIGNAAGTIVDYVTGLLSRFIEAIAVMILTSCLLPILVLIFMVWLLKMLFGIDFTQPKIINRVSIETKNE